MAYDVDLSRLSVSDYLSMLKEQTLLPGRRKLLDNMDGNFKMIRNMGIEDMAQLHAALSTKKKIDAFAKSSGIDGAYLVLLRRQIQSLIPKRVPLGDFPDVANEQIQALKEAGIKTSRDYYNERLNAADDLYRMCGLVRLNGVGALAARILLSAGYVRIEDVANADAKALLNDMQEVIVANGYDGVKLGEKDAKFCIDAAKRLTRLLA